MRKQIPLNQRRSATSPCESTTDLDLCESTANRTGSASYRVGGHRAPGRELSPPVGGAPEACCRVTDQISPRAAQITGHDGRAKAGYSEGSPSLARNEVLAGLAERTALRCPPRWRAAPARRQVGGKPLPPLRKRPVGMGAEGRRISPGA